MHDHGVPKKCIAELSLTVFDKLCKPGSAAPSAGLGVSILFATSILCAVQFDEFLYICCSE